MLVPLLHILLKVCVNINIFGIMNSNHFFVKQLCSLPFQAWNNKNLKDGRTATQCCRIVSAVFDTMLSGRHLPHFRRMYCFHLQCKRISFCNVKVEAVGACKAKAVSM
jgi:hypothetical protein